MVGVGVGVSTVVGVGVGVGVGDACGEGKVLAIAISEKTRVLVVTPYVPVATRSITEIWLAENPAQVTLKGSAEMAMSAGQVPPAVVKCSFKFMTEKSKPAISGT